MSTTIHFRPPGPVRHLDVGVIHSPTHHCSRNNNNQSWHLIPRTPMARTRTCVCSLDGKNSGLPTRSPISSTTTRARPQGTIRSCRRRLTRTRCGITGLSAQGGVFQESSMLLIADAKRVRRGSSRIALRRFARSARGPPQALDAQF